MQFYKMIMSPFTQLELLSHGLKGREVNFNIFPGQHNHQICTSLNHWSVLETRVRNRFPPPTSLQQLEHVLQEEWYKIPLQTVQNLYESIPRRTANELKAKVAQHHINKEMGITSVVFPLFCSTPVHIFQDIPVPSV
jgi:hypothetical protein